MEPCAPVTGKQTKEEIGHGTAWTNFESWMQVLEQLDRQGRAAASMKAKEKEFLSGGARLINQTCVRRSKSASVPNATVKCSPTLALLR